MTKREIELDRTICRRGHTVSGIEERTGTRVTGTLLGARRDDDPEVRFVCGEDGIYAIYERTMRRADTRPY